MGGLNWHAQDTIKRLGTVYPNLEFVLATAGDAAKQGFVVAHVLEHLH